MLSGQLTRRRATRQLGDNTGEGGPPPAGRTASSAHSPLQPRITENARPAGARVYRETAGATTCCAAGDRSTARGIGS